MNNIQGIGIQYNNNIGYNGVFKYGVNYSQTASFAQLMKSAGSDLYLDARKANGISQGINSPLVNPWVDFTKNGNNCLFQNLAGTTSDGWDLQAVVNSNGSVIDYANLVTNGDFSNGTTGWTAAGGTISVVSGELNITGNGTAVSLQAIQSITFTNGKRYYATVKAKVTNSNCTLIRIRNTNTTLGSVANPVNGTNYTLSGIFTASTDTNINLIHTYADTTTANGKVMICDDVQCINLTDNPLVQALETQLGHQLTALECDRIFQFVSTTGQTKVSARPFLKLDGVDTVGIIPNNPSVDIVGLDEFEIDVVMLTPSVLQTGFIVAKNLDTDATTQYSLYMGASGYLNMVINGTFITLTSNGMLTNTLYNIQVKRQNGILTAKLNGVEVYNQPNVINILTSRPNFRFGSRSINASGTSHQYFLNCYIGALSIAKNPDFTKLSSAWTKVVKDYI